MQEEESLVYTKFQVSIHNNTNVCKITYGLVILSEEL